MLICKDLYTEEDYTASAYECVLILNILYNVKTVFSLFLYKNTFLSSI